MQPTAANKHGEHSHEMTEGSLAWKRERAQAMIGLLNAAELDAVEAVISAFLAHKQEEMYQRLTPEAYVREIEMAEEHAKKGQLFDPQDVSRAVRQKYSQNC